MDPAALLRWPAEELCQFFEQHALDSEAWLPHAAALPAALLPLPPSLPPPWGMASCS